MFVGDWAYDNCGGACNLFQVCTSDMVPWSCAEHHISWDHPHHGLYHHPAHLLQGMPAQSATMANLTDDVMICSPVRESKILHCSLRTYMFPIHSDGVSLLQVPISLLVIPCVIEFTAKMHIGRPTWSAQAPLMGPQEIYLIWKPQSSQIPARKIEVGAFNVSKHCIDV